MGQKRALEQFRPAGLTEEFIARVVEIPGDRLWYPTYDELREANVITEIID